jgi:Zn-dependent membrane protease YugP
MVPFVNLCSYAGYIAIIIGSIMSALGLIWAGIIAEMVILLFQIVTLPVEFDASKRGLKEVKEEKILNDKEYKGGKVMLTSAALTYVASVATTVIQVLRLILIYGRRND